MDYRWWCCAVSVPSEVAVAVWDATAGGVYRGWEAEGTRQGGRPAPSPLPCRVSVRSPRRSSTLHCVSSTRAFSSKPATASVAGNSAAAPPLPRCCPPLLPTGPPLQCCGSPRQCRQRYGDSIRLCIRLDRDGASAWPPPLESSCKRKREMKERPSALRTPDALTQRIFSLRAKRRGEK